jgi:glycosyltransferase involved in cell wall biosynthesis
MEDWFDFDLIRESALRYPLFSFVLIGPKREAVKRLSGISNVHLLGSRDYASLPAYLRHADVGIIPNNVWDRPQLIHYMNPLKLYQYFACGLPVVASTSQELKDLKSPALLAENRKDFIRLLGKAVKLPKNSKVAFQYARRRDWSHAAGKLLRGLKT